MISSPAIQAWAVSPWKRAIGLYLAVLALSACAHGPKAKPSKDEAGRPQVLTVAILPFEDNSIVRTRATAGLGHTLADHITEKLSGEKALILIERESIDKVLEELAISTQGLTEAESRLRLGKLLGAQYLVVGGYMAIGPSLRVDARVIEIERGLAEGRAVEGGLAERARIEAELSQKISEVLIAKLGPQQAPVSSQDHYRAGLAHEKKKAFDKALDHYQQALAIDADNLQARGRMEALLLKELE